MNIFSLLIGILTSSQQNTIYNGQFQGNVLIVGKAECRKIYFVQKLAVKIFFGKTVKAAWV